MKNLSVIFLGLFLWLNAPAQSCLPEGILFTSQEQIDNFRQNYPGCTVIEGDVQIYGNDISNLDSLIMIKAINGNLKIGGNYPPVNPNLFSLSGLDSLHTVGGDLYIHYNAGLVNLTGVGGLKTIGGELSIQLCYSLASIAGLSGLTNIGTNLDIEDNPDLESLDGLQGIDTIPGNITIIGIDATDMTGLNGLIEIGGEFSLIDNYYLEDLEGLGSLTTIGTHFWLYYNDNISNLEGLNNLTNIGGWLNIEENGNLDSLTGLASLQSVGNLSVSDNDDLTNLKGLEGLNSIRFVGIYDNDNLVSLTGFEGLTTIEDGLGINSNDDLFTLTGLENLNSVNGGLGITYNESLTSLSGLEQLQSINGDLTIWFNDALTSLSGLDNITAGSISSIQINDNSSLTNCAVQSICDYLASPNGTVIICTNAPGCNNPAEIANECGFPLPCLPYGNYYLDSQAEIDSFQVLYPGCTMLEGSTKIRGRSITNLNGLSTVTSFGKRLDIFNVELTSLAGLEEVTHIGNGLEISNNEFLETLAGLDNFSADSTFDLSIYTNPALSTCDIESICNVLSGPIGNIFIGYNAPGCDYQEEVEANCGIGVDENPVAENFFRISPNPAHVRVNVETMQGECSMQLSLYNLNGQEVKRFEMNDIGVELDISSLQSGMYFLKAVSNKKSGIYKIIKM